MKIMIRAAAAAAALSCLALTAPTQAAPTQAAPAPAASSQTTPACTNADLHVDYRYSDSGAGSSYGWIRVTNVSRHACRTGGYGGVSYVGDGDGTQIGHAAIRVNRAAVRQYVVRPGQRLVSSLQMVRAGNYSKSTCRPARVDGFRVYVPNAYRSQFVAHRTTGCRNTAVHLLWQRPYHRP
ncbi:DUF4232 domain-containing protein [Nocardioides sp. Soil796]|uniref:DUF4232 domain-containing protein n=1 Tax=Nocardioides sp. Soil796 TaxID=1736412 RepID=UPI00070C472E|nr:DUF4232 domain-containing protein [Nocardioides sp. Soil796]KRF16288.1 hypothetical protein ASH02_06850 [Nocardioides sp. Soil796]